MTVIKVPAVTASRGAVAGAPRAIPQRAAAAWNPRAARRSPRTPSLQRGGGVAAREVEVRVDRRAYSANVALEAGRGRRGVRSDRKVAQRNGIYAFRPPPQRCDYAGHVVSRYLPGWREAGGVRGK